MHVIIPFQKGKSFAVFIIKQKNQRLLKIEKKFLVSLLCEDNVNSWPSRFAQTVYFHGIE